MEFKLWFNMENEAFVGNPELQIAWVLGKVAGTVVELIRKEGFVALSDSVKDSNGNAIGRVKIE